MIAVSKTKSKTSMWQFVFREEALAQWVVLALGVATAALAGRRGGRPAVVGVFCAGLGRPVLASASPVAAPFWAELDR